MTALEIALVLLIGTPYVVFLAGALFCIGTKRRAR